MENSWRALFFKSLLSKVPLPVDFNLGVPQKQTPQPLCLLSCQWVPEACVLAPKNLQSNSVLSLEKENSLLHGHPCGPAASENRWEGEQWKAPAGSLNVGTTGPWWMFMVFNFLRRWDFCLRVSKISISTLCSKTQRHCPFKVALLFSCSMSPSLHPAGLEPPWTFISDTKSRLLAEAVVTHSYQSPGPPQPCPSFLGEKLHLHFTLRSVERSCSPLKPDPLLSDGLRSFRAVVLKLHQV